MTTGDRSAPRASYLPGRLVNSHTGARLTHRVAGTVSSPFLSVREPRHRKAKELAKVTQSWDLASGVWAHTPNHCGKKMSWGKTLNFLLNVVERKTMLEGENACKCEVCEHPACSVLRAPVKTPDHHCCSFTPYAFIEHLLYAQMKSNQIRMSQGKTANVEH